MKALRPISQSDRDKALKWLNDAAQELIRANEYHLVKKKCLQILRILDRRNNGRSPE